MAHLNYEEGKKVVFRGFVLLGVVTILEVMVALIGKGYVIHGFHLPRSIMYLLMISMSLYKAYYIVYEFMHMRYEVPGLVRSVLMPTLLLVWAIIAFFYEGNTWRKWRSQINDRPIAQFSAAKPHGAPAEHTAPVDTTHKQEMPPAEMESQPADTNRQGSH